MKGKKTFEVKAFKDYVNAQLTRTDKFATESFKSALCVALEEVLHKTNNYKGYNDLYWLEIGWDQWTRNGKTEVWEEKNKFIYGEAGTKYDGCKYSRRYY